MVTQFLKFLAESLLTPLQESSIACELHKAVYVHISPPPSFLIIVSFPSLDDSSYWYYSYTWLGLFVSPSIRSTALARVQYYSYLCSALCHNLNLQFVIVQCYRLFESGSESFVHCRVSLVLCRVEAYNLYLFVNLFFRFVSIANIPQISNFLSRFM